jgi:hypothetical protein
MHIKCQVPGTCTFTGIAPALTTLPNSTEIAGLLQSNGYPPLPNASRVDSSNLLVEGLVFDRMTGETINRTRSIVDLGGFGLNMKIKDCLWTQANATFPPYAAIELTRGSESGVIRLGGGSLQKSLELNNCTIRDNVFNYAIVTVSDGYIANLTAPSQKLTVENSLFEKNTIKSMAFEGGVAYSSAYSGCFSIRSAILNCASVMFNNNTMIAARGAVVLVDTELSATRFRFQSNSILTPLGRKCTDVARLKTTVKSSNVSYVDVGCREYTFHSSPTKKPTPTKMPTKMPTNKPTRMPTKMPTNKPTKVPTRKPTKKPTRIPTKKPTK